MLSEAAAGGLWPAAGSASADASAAVEGAVLGTYTFDRYRQERDDFFTKEASLTILDRVDVRRKLAPEEYTRRLEEKALAHAKKGG